MEHVSDADLELLDEKAVSMADSSLQPQATGHILEGRVTAVGLLVDMPAHEKPRHPTMAARVLGKEEKNR
jgi:hypothetical protein